MSFTRPLLIAAVVCATVIAGCDGGPEPLAPDFARQSQGPSLTATAASPTQINLAWVDDAKNIIQFDIHRSTTGASGAFTLLATVGPTARTFSDQGLRSGTEYCYRVRSLRRSGKGVLTESFTQTACATTLIPAAVPGAPPAIAARGWLPAYPGSGNSILVSWQPSAGTVHGYRIERSTDDGATWLTIGTSGSSATDLTDGAPPIEQVICYRVIAFNDVGDSPASARDCVSVPNRPSGLAVIAYDGVSTVTLRWDDNSGLETGYEVWLGYELYPNVWGQIAWLPPNSTSFTDAAFDPQAGGNYLVIAVGGDAYSDWSDFAVWPSSVAGVRVRGSAVASSTGSSGREP